MDNLVLALLFFSIASICYLLLKLDRLKEKNFSLTNQIIDLEETLEARNKVLSHKRESLNELQKLVYDTLKHSEEVTNYNQELLQELKNARLEHKKLLDLLHGNKGFPSEN